MDNIFSVADKKLGKVLNLIPDEPNKELITILEDWLKFAKDGSLTGIAGIVLIKGDGPEWAIMGSAIENFTNTLGIIEVMKHDIICRIGTSSEDYNGCPDPTG